MSDFNVEKFRVEDLKQNLLTLSHCNASTPPEKIVPVLKKLLIFSVEGGDAVSETIDNGAVKALSDLFSVSKSKDVKSIIASILILLSFRAERSDENELVGIVISALANIYVVSDLKVFLQSFTSLKDVVSTDSFSSSSPSPSPSPSLSASSPSFSTSLSLSVSAVLLERITAVLSQPSSDRDKQDLLDAFVELVGSGTMNEAAQFAAWSTGAGGSGGSGGGGGGGGRGGGGSGGGGDSGGGETEGNSYSIRFLKAFEAFSKSLKGLWEGKRKCSFTVFAQRIDEDIKNQQFFPTFSSVALPLGKPPQSAPAMLPLKFFYYPDASGRVTVSGGKHTWLRDCTYLTVALDQEIVSGIYKAVVECKGKFGGNMTFGLCPKSHITGHNSNHTGQAGAVMICYNGFYGGVCYSNNFFASTGAVTLGVEVNADSHTAHFFVDGKQVPYCYVNVPSSVYIFICDYYANNVVDVKSFQKLDKPTIDASLQCTQYAWK